MIANRIRRAARFLGILALSGFAHVADSPLSPADAQDDASSYVIIVHAENKIKEADIRVMAKGLYLGLKARWPNGKAAKPFSRPVESEEHKALLTTILEMDDEAVAAHFKRRGKDSPELVDNDSDMLVKVASDVGGFGVIGRAIASMGAGVRVIPLQ